MNYLTAVAILLSLGYCAAFSNAASCNEDENLRCFCHCNERRRIPTNQIKQVTIFPSSARCKHTEIMVIIKSDNRICVQVTAPWVKKLIDYLLENSAAENIS
ncbi:interleukin-8-like [Mobula hypostoma]|uniref:interleukin-8-like n=1 Tax=Mobula hypostoma TaxID=723540 RepID=UPI002FC3D33A